MIELSGYSLPDIKLLADNPPGILIWIPDKKYIVLGASNTVEDSLVTENVIQDNVTVMKRISGGQTVLLTPECLVVSCVFDNSNHLQPKDIFYSINLLIKNALEKTGVRSLSLTGISDIAISGKKISGSAIYKNRDKLLYHAVLNIGEPAASIEKYLKQPAKQPDYRNGRKHTDFVTSLRGNGFTGKNSELATIIEQTLMDKLQNTVHTIRAAANE
ncbi:hypothetical protein SDC9_53311 [bioreactor metagenome]|uniref:BPL/LPL catalytic domain-containing protein n=1 Tax=bioreactor metagenome TaxID=1076179 RepID=A0A644WTJ4_9ZZZZ